MSYDAERDITLWSYKGFKKLEKKNPATTEKKGQ